MPGYDSTARVPFAKGGRVGLADGSPHPSKKVQTEEEKKKIERAKKREEYYKKHGVPDRKRIQIKPKLSDERQKTLTNIRFLQNKGGRVGRQFGGRAGLKAGGDGKWIQKVNASIKRRGTKGKCTPITKKGCTGRAKALAKTFKKMAKKRKAA